MKKKTLLKNGICWKTWFSTTFPHHAVIKNERDTTKTRIVFEQSSKIGNNPSSNDFLHSGPCLLPLIFDILLRFRIGDMAFGSRYKTGFLTHRN